MEHERLSLWRQSDNCVFTIVTFVTLAATHNCVQYSLFCFQASSVQTEEAWKQIEKCRTALHHQRDGRPIHLGLGRCFKGSPSTNMWCVCIFVFVCVVSYRLPEFVVCENAVVQVVMGDCYSVAGCRPMPQIAGSP